MAPRRTLLFGGSFDPPHRAHVEVPAQAADVLGCERIVYIPAAQNPLKAGTEPTAGAHRLAMLKIAVRDMPRAEISTIELDRGGASYFVETLETLRNELAAEGDLRFLIGADQTLEFRRWRSWRRILELATPAVVLRPPWTDRSLREALVETYDAEDALVWTKCIVAAPLLDINATDLRRRLASGADVSDAIDPAVLAYIRVHGLYA